MLEQLMDLIKQNSQEAITDNPEVPNEQNGEVMQTAGTSIMDSLKNMLSGGGAANVLNLFNQNSKPEIENHPVTQNVSNDLIGNLMNKFGFSNGKASGIASMIVPLILSKLVHKTNDSNDGSINIQSVFNSLSGGKTGGMDIGSMVSKFGGSGLDKNHDGKVDLSDLTAAFSNSPSSGEGENKGGGLMDTISGLFGK